MSISTIFFAVLSPTVPVTNAAATYITGAANSQTLIKRAVVTNITGGAITFNLWRVPSGGTAVNGNLVLNTQSVGANSQYLLPELANMVLYAGDTIQIQASANTSLNFTASGFTAQ